MCVYILFFHSEDINVQLLYSFRFLPLVILKVSFSAHFTEATDKLHISARLIMKKSSHDSLERKLVDPKPRNQSETKITTPSGNRTTVQVRNQVV
jgi:hypothetical protein